MAVCFGYIGIQMFRQVPFTLLHAYTSMCTSTYMPDTHTHTHNHMFRCVYKITHVHTSLSLCITFLYKHKQTSSCLLHAHILICSGVCTKSRTYVHTSISVRAHLYHVRITSIYQQKQTNSCPNFSPIYDILTYTYTQILLTSPTATWAQKSTRAGSV